MEQDIEKFLHDATQQQLELKPLPNSYLRLAAYRIAQHYGLQSMSVPDNNTPDGSSSRIVVQKTSECHPMPIRLADIPVNLPQDDNHGIVRVAIKQRPQKHSQSINSGNTVSSKTNHSKSVEERKEEYNRARARIFSNNSSSGNQGKSESKTPLPDSFQCSSVVSTQSEDNSFSEGPEIDVALGFGYPSGGSSRSGVRAEKEPVVNRFKASSRVAVFRDRELDRKDPDYDRNYDRYMQRFDPGFGFNGGTYGIQPLYTPAVNYNTEFPQLGASHRPQISIDHQPQSIPQLLHGPWGTTSSSTTLGYGPPESLLAPFNANHGYAHSNSSIYVPSSASQYIAPPRPGTGLIHPHEHGQHFAQTNQHQPETSLGSARPH
ncbi:hypothetical protein Taro_050779 [Colocasia esculenta]|uniref:SUZ domain-containing protein n=1 Tax=Colocasia esculenta TaxID=4460 RepID=A0A843XF00_COLES|nr:hypothetical protein [Colocasia esculenta]